MPWFKRSPTTAWTATRSPWYLTGMEILPSLPRFGGSSSKLNILLLRSENHDRVRPQRNALHLRMELEVLHWRFLNQGVRLDRAQPKLLLSGHHMGTYFNLRLRVTSSIWITSRTWGSATCSSLAIYFSKVLSAFNNVLYLYPNDKESKFRVITLSGRFFLGWILWDGRVWCDAHSQWEYPSGRWW